jgi:hypothetical protein
VTLRLNVDTLVNDHLTTGPDGSLVHAEALLNRLEAAVHPTNGGGATTQATKAKLPLDAGALALWQDLEREARDNQWEMLATTGTLRGILRSWAASVPYPGWKDHLTTVTERMVERVRAYLDPVKVYRPSAPCPACGVRFHGEDRHPVLSVVLESAPGVWLPVTEHVLTCAACGAEWAGEAYMWITRSIRADSEKITA